MNALEEYLWQEYRQACADLQWTQTPLGFVTLCVVGCLVGWFCGHSYATY